MSNKLKIISKEDIFYLLSGLNETIMLYPLYLLLFRHYGLGPNIYQIIFINLSSIFLNLYLNHRKFEIQYKKRINIAALILLSIFNLVKINDILNSTIIVITVFFFWQRGLHILGNPKNLLFTPSDFYKGLLFMLLPYFMNFIFIRWGEFYAFSYPYIIMYSVLSLYLLYRIFFIKTSFTSGNNIPLPLRALNGFLITLATASFLILSIKKVQTVIFTVFWKVYSAIAYLLSMLISILMYPVLILLDRFFTSLSKNMRYRTILEQINAGNGGIRSGEQIEEINNYIMNSGFFKYVFAITIILISVFILFMIANSIYKKLEKNRIADFTEEVEKLSKTSSKKEKKKGLIGRALNIIKSMAPKNPRERVIYLYTKFTLIIYKKLSLKRIPSETPQEYAKRIEVILNKESSINKITEIYMKAKYGHEEITENHIREFSNELKEIT